VTASRRRKIARRIEQLALVLLVMGALYLAERGPEAWEGSADAAANVVPVDAQGPCRVHRVIDGDTVRMRCDGEEMKVRLLRIDTPEREEPRYREATEALRRLVNGRDVHFTYEEPGRPTRGNYGRLLVYLYADAKNINVEMVRAGWSRFDTRWGEGRFAGAFRAAEREAREAGRL
jgi:endonuclease YncB( thermonuclease family)